jgi:deoxyribodipyrimidine photo-lyase
MGERYFMEHLVDGDFASNNGGWGFSASTGVDPQPYFRIFNPLLQSERFDREGRILGGGLGNLRGWRGVRFMIRMRGVRGRRWRRGGIR